MRRILLDQNVPRGVRQILAGHDVRTAYRAGWSALSNGDLLAAAERAGFEVFITCDQNLQHQNILAGSFLAVVVLTTTHWPTIRAHSHPIVGAVEEACPGVYAVVSLPRPARRRRVPPGRNVPE